MNPRSTIKPGKLLTFLLPALIPLPFILTHAHYILYLSSWLLCILVTAVYPIISAIVFIDNVMIWSAPVVYTVMTTIVTLWIYVWSGGPAGDQFMFLLPFICLHAIGWSVMWTLIVKQATKKSSSKEHH